jgi:hypothetical protein
MNSCHRIVAPHGLAGQCESIFAMILSAKAIASEIEHSDAGEFLPSHCVNLRGKNAGGNQNYALSALVHDPECTVFAFCSLRQYVPLYQLLPKFAENVPLARRLAETDGAESS